MIGKLFKYIFILGTIISFLSIIFPSVAVINDYNGGTSIPEEHIYDDTIKGAKLRYPLPDKNINPLLDDKPSPLHGSNPSNIETEVVYDPATNEYIFKEKVGNSEIGVPFSVSFDDYKDYNFDKAMRSYWRQRAKSSVAETRDSFIPKLEFGGEIFDRIFGGNIIDFRPHGSLNLKFGVEISKAENLNLNTRNRTNVNFLFESQIQMNVVGQIGEKLKINAQFDTQQNAFDFENSIKIEYTGHEDEIIQKIELGNVSLPLTGTLITGSQSLLGVKAEAKFGKLTLTSIFSQKKSESSTIEVEGGAQTKEFEIKSDKYEANKHYFLSHYFKENYDKALKTLPVINSGINITRIEVWITNKAGNFENSRNLVAFADLGESNKQHMQSQYVANSSGTSLTISPRNDNNILVNIDGDTGGAIRDLNQVSTSLLGFQMVSGIDYEKIESARLLQSNEYTLNPKLGYISLNSTLNSDQVLAVAYEYTLGGNVYQVGEFSNSAISAPKSLVLKLIKGTSFTPKIKTWGLMMKNIYNIGAYQLGNQDFILDIFYNNEKTGTDINYLPVGAIDNIRLLTVLNLDKLNSQLDPYPDGVFDYIESITVNSNGGRIIFPVIEPFGSHLREKITNGDPNKNKLADPYVFQELYDSTQNVAQQLAEKNKYRLKGRYKSTGGSEISLNAMNVPQGSVSVTAGSVKLTENVDYTVNYNLGRVKIINLGILESKTPIKINLESNSLINLQTKTLIGAHANYEFSKDFNIGATVLKLTEKPLTSKVSIGYEPISNTIWGVNGSYRKDVPFLTKCIDFLPFIATKEMSTITMTGEFAQLIPGHSRAISKEGNAYIDDFEAAKTTLDVKSPYAWGLSSTPADSLLFPESSYNNNLRYGYNRARIAWYVIDPIFHETGTPISADARSSHYVRQIYEKELFPKRDGITSMATNMAALNVVFYPSERGPYNYDVDNIDVEGNLLNPQKRWGGITRQLQTTDFEEANIEYIEFWLMDPFVEDSSNIGGDLYFNLGDISEDILKDGRKAFEHGLPTPKVNNPVDTTAWGLVPLMQSVVPAFDIDPEARLAQDVGLDGLSDVDERKFFSRATGRHDYLDQIALKYGVESQAYKKAYKDPSSDNFHHHRGSDYDSAQLNILERYKMFNGVERNSLPDNYNKEPYTVTGQTTPNVEDINKDNTLSESNNYFQYRISMRKEDMQVGSNFITDKVIINSKLANDKTSRVSWYQFKVPIHSYEKRVGSIHDFKSIRFMRMFLTNFIDPTVLRFATISLVRGEWRKYNSSFMQPGEYLVDELSDTPFEVNAVNIEENSSKVPVNYILPPGIDRQIEPMNPQMRQLNEQSMSIKVLRLQDGDARAVFKNVNLDVRKYLRLKMFVHAESVPTEPALKDNELSLFVRLGTDYRNNYYEYEIPLKVTPAGNYKGDESENAPDRYLVWPEINNLDLEFSILQSLKQDRNDELRAGNIEVSITRLYSRMVGNKKISIMGNPNLSNVQTIMIGVRNPRKTSVNSEDDGLMKSGEIWVNELRLTNFDEQGGWAANARITAKLAELGSVTLAGSTSKPGFGAINQKVGERQKEEINRYDVSSNFELGKFFPEKLGVSIPFYIGYSENVRNPQYNPLDPDIPFKVTLDNPNLTKEYKDSVKHLSQDYNMRKSFNFTNVKVNKQGGGTSKIYDLSNISLSYGYNETYERNVNTIYNSNKLYTGALFYNYNATPKIVEPFKKVKFLNNKFLQLIKDFNFYYLPSQLSFRTNINRSYTETQLRNVYNTSLPIPINVKKDFTWTRQYDLKYNFSKGLKFEFSATNNARIDEPQGRMYKGDPDYQAKRDTVWDNFKNLGRNTQYHHTWNLSYTLPLNKIPLLNWVSANARYAGTYDWSAGPITADTIKLGNTLQNGNTISLNTQFNLTTLYNKVKYLNDINRNFRESSSRPQKKEKEQVTYNVSDVKLRANKEKVFNHKLKTESVTIVVTTQDGKPVAGDMRIIDENKIGFKTSEDQSNLMVVVNGTRDKKESFAKKVLDNTLFLLMSVKNISIGLNETNGTLMPGYLPQTKIMGMSNYTADPAVFGPTSPMLAPTIPFILGWQEPDFGEWACKNNFITRDSTNIQAMVQSHTRGWNARASIEPIRDLKIDLNLQHSLSKNNNKYYRYAEDPNTNIHRFLELNPSVSGTFSMTIVSAASAFEAYNKDGNYTSEAFKKFSSNRIVIANRLASQRPDFNGQVDSCGYPVGFGQTSQDVLVIAFLSAYTNQDPNKVALETLPTIYRALPNWRITYDGLTKIQSLKKIFRSVNLNHVYRSTFNVGNYQSRLLNEYSENADGFNTIRDALSNYYSKYQINGVSITEQFSPLFSIDMTLVNSFIAKIEFKKTRTLNMSFTNNQLSELKGDDYVFGTGYRFKDVEIIITTGGRQHKFKSDLNLRLDFTIRKNLAIIRKLEEGFNQPTAAQTNYAINASADYVLNNRLTVQLFYDQELIRPQIQGTSFKRSNTKFGFSIRFSFAN